YGFAPSYTHNSEIAGLRNQTIVGGRFFGGSNIALQYINLSGSRGAQTLNSRQDAVNLEGYFENRLFVLPELAAVVVATVIYEERQYTNYGGLPASPVPQDNERNYNGVAPKVGLLWEPKKDIQGFINVSKSLDVPDFGDLTQTQNNGSTSFVPLQAQNG